MNFFSLSLLLPIASLWFLHSHWEHLAEIESSVAVREKKAHIVQEKERTNALLRHHLQEADPAYLQRELGSILSLEQGKLQAFDTIQERELHLLSLTPVDEEGMKQIVSSIEKAPQFLFQELDVRKEWVTNYEELFTVDIKLLQREK